MSKKIVPVTVNVVNTVTTNYICINGKPFPSNPYQQVRSLYDDIQYIRVNEWITKDNLSEAEEKINAIINQFKKLDVDFTDYSEQIGLKLYKNNVPSYKIKTLQDILEAIVKEQEEVESLFKEEVVEKQKVVTVREVIEGFEKDMNVERWKTVLKYFDGKQTGQFWEDFKQKVEEIPVNPLWTRKFRPLWNNVVNDLKYIDSE